MTKAKAPESTATCSRLCPWYSGFSRLVSSSGISTSGPGVSSKRACASEHPRCPPDSQRAVAIPDRELTTRAARVRGRSGPARLSAVPGREAAQELTRAGPR
eukprot:55556-Alexandrium_andersonii.AAC.1